MFTTHDLAVLVAVADSGSVRRAAAVIGRTQPAVTQAIQRLEEAVGFALFDRSGYRVRLTDRGTAFLKRARAAVRQARELREFASVLSHGVEPSLRIGVHGAIPLSSWLQLVEDLSKYFPDTAIEIQTGEGDAPVRRLMSGEVDLSRRARRDARRSRGAGERLASRARGVRQRRSSEPSRRQRRGLPRVLAADSGR